LPCLTEQALADSPTRTSSTKESDQRISRNSD
jgi:hypothetical protein